MNAEFKLILEDENLLLEQISEEQLAMREAVNHKDWTGLMTSISESSRLSEAFKALDSRRENIQSSLKKEEVLLYSDSISSLRSKLLRCKAESRAFESYVKISRKFIQQIVEKALPQSRNKNYSRTGNIVQLQPQSLVVNQLF